MTQSERLTLEQATRLLTSVFTAAGANLPVAHSVSAALVAAEAEGQRGHGFSRVADYAAQMRSGKIRAQAEVKIRQTGTASLLADADGGFAYPALDLVIREGADLARAHGCASLGVTRSHHCGALSVQVAKLASHGLVALMVANTPAAMAPYGGSTAFFGTNPIAFAAPRENSDPLVIDLSLSKVARGKVMAAHKAGEPIPEGWALDREGQPTTDPAEALAGTMLPIADAKGTALALMVEILATTMTGAAFSADASSFFTAEGPAPHVGQFLIAMTPQDAHFSRRLDVLLDRLQALEGARLPGSRRAAALRAAHANGLEVASLQLEHLRTLARGV